MRWRDGYALSATAGSDADILGSIAMKRFLLHL
jgi:hypothetical protein